FFSSSRRHTRWPRDWSSDVCSSDLLADRLPDRGTSWYLSKLRAARRRIGESLQNPALSDEAISSLQRVIEQTEVLEVAWDELDQIGRASGRERGKEGDVVERHSVAR